MKDEKYLLEEIANDNGLIYVKEAEANGIDRFRLSYLAKENKIDRLKHGVYSLKDEIVDEYVLIQSNSKRIIFSYDTALYFHDLSDRVPSHIHISVPQGYNASRLKQRHDNLDIHYVNKDTFKLGIEKRKSPLGGEIIIYDVERTVCDIVKSREKIEPQAFIGAIKRYFSNKNINYRKLIKYAQELKIEKEIRNYLDVLL
ncbi:type IV toxin-antitoxin system AbiEi family antitoxin domain-containing protein [Helcococcus kunzii]|uniref:type IV toxin-antitoxin system AbiEi family antitoxin domain-containing protein n=1 Tax=Helcococcus kunzii TaxID=40091 RepID=UPI0021A389D5|nr:type IV toxin-antitoxin system AbiEi family antitoxin domain-containing protein [Helcococcus kunzii]MCT1796476.1 type IV toxin-antitoxin system AbiEi family antitoxin domain-containing protein [Helcococcus kunzii]MCT1989047.1 type IV toxin-antitoxin system AbiEi family antitoxin domain-containing protein [Helcococcus kunzii]